MSNQPPPTIIWTALPNGWQGDQLSLTIFVSPRLYCDKKTTLADFEYLSDWPGVLRDVSFGVEFSGSVGVQPAHPSSLESDASDYWKKLFPPTSRVRPYQYQDYMAKTWYSYPIRRTLTYLKDLYQTTAKASPLSLMPLDGPVFRRLRNELSFDAEVPNPDFEGVRNFFNRRLETFQIALPKWEFHELVSALGDHPRALRKLGLVIDLLFPSVSQQGGDKLRLVLKWNSPIPAPRNLCPWTHFLLRKGVFEAAQRPQSEFAHGYLNLERVDDRLADSHPCYDLVQVDPDGSALKLINLANSLVTMRQGSDEFGENRREGLPSLRSAGIALTRLDRKIRLQRGLTSAAQHNDVVENSREPELEFYAEDLLRGYRVDILDIKDPAGEWRSLCRRRGSIVFPGTGLDELGVADEGYVKSASAASAKPGSDQLYLHEALVRWDGWSLVVQRPGLSSASATERLGRSANTAHPDFPFEAHYVAPQNSLPRLRFGHTYRISVRTVDLAGNGLPFLPKEPVKGSFHATTPLTYYRYEPLNPPVLVPRRPYVTGESVERLVIRSNHDRSAHDWAAEHPGCDETCERHVVPPKSSGDLAETHGALDPWLNRDIREAYYVMMRQQGDLASDEIVDLQNGEPVSANAIIQVVDEGKPGSYIMHAEEQLILPYLPDPAAAGASLWQDLENMPKLPNEWRWPTHTAELFAGLPAGMGKRQDVFFDVQVPFGVSPDSAPSDWPIAWPFRLVLTEARQGASPGSFAYDSRTRVLTVFLDKAQVLSLRYSTLPDAKKLDDLGIWRWVEEVAEGHPILGDRDNALAGFLWQLSPYRSLTLVHAVQQPLRAPDFQNGPWIWKNKLGDTYVNVRTGLNQHTASTSKVQLLAQWEDPLDDPQSGSPVDANGNLVMRIHRQQVLDFAVGVDFNQDLAIGSGDTDPQCVKQALEVRHELGDTKHHWVDYLLRGTTRFREYFPANPNDQRTQPEQYLTYEIGNHTRSCPTQRRNVKNTARPPVPQVAYVVPNFGWREEQTPDGFTRTRLGGGLRVYLERPWYASGPDELLGVVLWPNQGVIPPPSQETIPSDRHHLVTQFGLDPLWASKMVEPHLTMDDFFAPGPNGVPSNPERRDKGSDLGLTLLKSPDSSVDIVVDIVGYQPQYNRDQRRWYADFQINPDKIRAYYPFLRLALVRYQPYSHHDAHLSTVVLTDFIQLVPTRTLSFGREARQGWVRLEGWAPRQAPAPAGQRTTVELTVESFDTAKYAAGDPLGWQPAESGLVTISPPTTSFPGVEVDPNYLFYEFQLGLPLQPIDPVTLFRLVVKEWEVFETPGTDGTVAARRVVYVDTIDLLHRRRPLAGFDDGLAEPQMRRKSDRVASITGTT